MGLILSLIPGSIAQTQQDAAAVRDQILKSEVFDFGKVRMDDVVEHTFRFHNPGPEPLVLKNVQLSPPLIATKLSRQVGPGESGAVTVRLGERRQPGEFEGIVILNFNSVKMPACMFRVQGRVVHPIDFEPLGAFYITSFRGELQKQSIEMVNYQSEPLEPPKVEYDSSRFTADVAAIEPGRRYRLTVTVKPDASAGRTTEPLRLITSDVRRPVIQLPVNTQVRERVYAFPDALTLGLIETAELKSNKREAAYLTQSVTVYQRNGTDFRIAATTDLPFLKITQRQVQLKDRFEVVAEVVPEMLRAGSYNGAILLKTNDPQFPELRIPVTCRVTADW